VRRMVDRRRQHGDGLAHRDGIREHWPSWAPKELREAGHT
jgi:hypothetical protein